MIVYTLGEVDYDIRTETPRGVFSSAEGAKDHAGPGVTWTFTRETGCWWGVAEDGSEYEVAAFVVDESVGRSAPEPRQLTVAELRHALRDFTDDDVVRVVVHGYEHPSQNLPARYCNGPVAVSGQARGYSLLIVAEEPREDRRG